MKNSRFVYKSCITDAGFLYIACNDGGDKKASKLANLLAGEGAYIYYDIMKGEPREAADAITKAKATVFILTKDAVDSLAFRNKVNFAINEKKHIICLNVDDCKLSYGLEMQLANIPVLRFESVGNAMDILKEKEVLTQEVMGGSMDRVNISYTRRIVTGVIIAIAIIGFLVGSFFIIKGRMDYLNSDAYRITQYGNVLGSLDLSNMGISDISAISGMTIRVLDISNNPLLTDMSPLLEVKGLEKVYVDQDMLKYLVKYKDSGFLIIANRMEGEE